MSKKIYLITGATGLLGSNIIKQLKDNGEEVRAFVLKGDPAAKRIPAGVEIVYGDVTNTESLKPLFQAEEGKELIVIHCAGIVTVTEGYNERVYQVNVNGTKNIIYMCVTHRVSKLVYVSSTSAIPELPDGQVIREADSYSPEGITGFYGQTKAEATQIVLDAVKKYDLDASIVFPSGICGPNDYANGPVSSFIREYVRGEMPAGIEGYFNAVDVRDLARGCIACAARGNKGEGYIMANQLVTIREMFDLLSGITGCKNVKIIIPIGIAKLLGKLNDVVGKITGIPGKMTSFAVYNLARNNNFSCKKAEQELGYKIRPFEETIKDELIWMRNEGLLTWNENKIVQSIGKHVPA